MHSFALPENEERQCNSINGLHVHHQCYRKWTDTAHYEHGHDEGKGGAYQPEDQKPNNIHLVYLKKALIETTCEQEPDGNDEPACAQFI